MPAWGAFFRLTATSSFGTKKLLCCILPRTQPGQKQNLRNELRSTQRPRNLGTAQGEAMEITDEIWERICRLFEDAMESSFHCTFASVGEDGVPRATPIGSLILASNRRGFYFEEYSSGLPRNLRTNKRVCVLAVNTSKRLWFKMLLLGEFTETFAVRLMGTAGEKRPAAKEEIALFRNRVSSYRMLKGYGLIWGHLTQVRDITFDSFEPVRIGPLQDFSEHRL